jgi:hypothetical protein
MASSKKTLLTEKSVQGMRVDETLPDCGDHRGLRVTRTTRGGDGSIVTGWEKIFSKQPAKYESSTKTFRTFALNVLG